MYSESAIAMLSICSGFTGFGLELLTWSAAGNIYLRELVVTCKFLVNSVWTSYSLFQYLSFNGFATVSVFMRGGSFPAS